MKIDLTWRREVRSKRMEVVPALLGIGAGVMLMGGEVFGGMLISATAIVLEFLDVKKLKPTPAEPRHTEEQK